MIRTICCNIKSKRWDESPMVKHSSLREKLVEVVNRCHVVASHNVVSELKMERTSCKLSTTGCSLNIVFFHKML